MWFKTLEPKFLYAPAENNTKQEQSMKFSISSIPYVESCSILQSECQSERKGSCKMRFPDRKGECLQRSHLMLFHFESSIFI